MRDIKKVRPKVLVSKCLEHESCRYDGSMIGNNFVKKLKDFVDFIPICPEVAIGLTITREAVRVIKDGDSQRLVFSRSGNDVTDDMETYAKETIKALSERPLHGAILKSRSPTCGIKDVKIYDSFGKSPSLGFKTSGFFGGPLSSALTHLAIEDEGRLTNYTIREHFLTRIYIMASFDLIKEKKKINDLVTFQNNNKYLLMAYNQNSQKSLGKLVAKHDHTNIEEIYKEYENLLAVTFSTSLKRGKNINTLLHIFGYFKNDLNSNEKAYFLDVLEQYNDEKAPFSVPLSILGSWVIRFENEYLLGQTIFEPFPRELVHVTDSGKGID